MQSAYLSIETHEEHPGLIRMALSEWRPAIPETTAQKPRRVRYVARVNDGEAALMHVHHYLRKRLVDVNTRLYRCDPASAVAAVESIGVAHSRIYIDPEFGPDTHVAIQSMVLNLIEKRYQRKRYWDLLGYAALGFLLLQFLTGLL